MNYKQFENIATRKAISAYGGVGSILETRDGAILVNDFNDWAYFRALNGSFNEEHTIEDKRFKNRLKKYFKKLENLKAKQFNLRLLKSGLKKIFRSMPKGNLLKNIKIF